MKLQRWHVRLRDLRDGLVHTITVRAINAAEAAKFVMDKQPRHQQFLEVRNG